jgi:hypothetical protein
VRGRTGTIAALAATVATLALAAPAGAATVTIGQVAPVLGTPSGCISCTYFQRQIAMGSPSYEVPAGGPWTVNSWSARAGNGANDFARLRILRPTGAAGEYTIAAETQDFPFPAGGSAPVHQVAVPVQPGDLIAARTVGSVGGIRDRYPAAVGNTEAVAAGNPAVGTTFGPAGYSLNTSSLANVSATLSAPDPVAPKKKCKKKKGKKKSAAAKKKKCGKKKKKK